MYGKHWIAFGTIECLLDVCVYIHYTVYSCYEISVELAAFYIGRMCGDI
jgi:hypothetical protein